MSSVQADFIDSEAQVNDPTLRALFGYWDQLPKFIGRRSYRHFDALKIPPAVLPHVTVMEILDQGRDMRYRLVGTHIDEHIGIPLSGLALSETPFEDQQGIMAKINHSVTSGRPQFFLSSIGSCADFFQQVARLYLPMTRDGESYDIIVGGAVISRRPHTQESYRDYLLRIHAP